MGSYVAVITVSIIVVAMVIILSMVTLSKGYGYKHKIDPLPDEEANRYNDRNEVMENKEKINS
ncbi:YtzI protein [Oceanobacillus sp. J11TS1]|uniref:YtzI protein n=1 Tax=Oceanobacillus sp. J11TS1 TaxID=2807191 RepID=UPI001B186B09|nr:YtzI protein [Oceanobacillus sp. J11TS1]GIO24571.1 hypothetical protein J11TS1_31520 [Oceanobacillus sp. J11TS1]